MHKGRHLVKMMMIVSTTGYIIEAYGPYLANGSNNISMIVTTIS